MFEMLKNLVDNLAGGPATRRYPEVARPPFPSSRGRIEGVIENCIFCEICQKRCPADCITVNKDEKTWSVDPYQCIVCGVCVEVCPAKPKAIIMHTEYRQPRYERTPLTHHQEGTGEDKVGG